MLLKKITIYIALFVMLFGCTSTNKPSDSSAELPVETNVPDTLVNSIPANYLGALDTITVSQKMHLNSYQELLDLFDTLNYTPETWQAGIREIPRVYLTVMGDKWGSVTSKEITVQYKKQIFFRGIAPLVLRANELIMADRTRLEKIYVNPTDTVINSTDSLWINKLANLYRVKTDKSRDMESILEELWLKVDIVPPSLALGQSAEESGWGTSRFAAQGNALYGQWTWGANAMVPDQQRKELGNYGIAAFASLQESVCGYMLNLNTHNAYAKLRNKRAELRKNNELITGLVLAEQLDKYSERGEAYVVELQKLINYNHLNPVDEAFLSNSLDIYLLPANE